MPGGGAGGVLAWDGPSDLPGHGSAYPSSSTGSGTSTSLPRHRATRRRRSPVLLAAFALLITALLIVAAASLLVLVRGGAADSHPGVPMRPTQSKVASRQVTCWNATTAANPHACGIPQGRAGLATVFSSLVPSCASVPSARRGEVENVACRTPGYVIRYSRWQPGFDRFGYYDRRNARTGARWSVSGAFAGRQWSSLGTDADGDPSYRWTATYRSEPFAVEVVASTARGRAAGVATVHAAASSHLGRG